MKALSIRPDYAWDIMDQVKKHEYRSWSTSHRGDLLICSTARKIKGFISGHAICVVNLSSVHQLSDGTYAWKLEDVRLIKPFEVKGQLRLFNVDDQLIHYPDEKDIELESGIEVVTEDFWNNYYESLTFL